MGSPAEEGDLRTEVLVLGAGPGGYTAAFRAADLGKRVVLVERHAALLIRRGVARPASAGDLGHHGPNLLGREPRLRVELLDTRLDTGIP